MAGTRRKALATVVNGVGVVTASKRHKPEPPTTAQRAAASLDVAPALPDSHCDSLGGGPCGAAAESTGQVRRPCA